MDRPVRFVQAVMWNKWRGFWSCAICIRPLHGSFVLLAIVDIRAQPEIFILGKAP